MMEMRLWGSKGREATDGALVTRHLLPGDVRSIFATQECDLQAHEPLTVVRHTSKVKMWAEGVFARGRRLQQVCPSASWGCAAHASHTPRDSRMIERRPALPAVAAAASDRAPCRRQCILNNESKMVTMMMKLHSHNCGIVSHLGLQHLT